MKDVSVEYAHIYTNSHIGKEHELSVDILNRLKKSLNKKKQTFSLVVMIDDYSFPDPTFNYGTFLDWLGDKGFAPDVVFRESQLIPLCDLVLKKIKDAGLRAQLIDYIKGKKYPCSLFVAAWYLLRLGYIHDSKFNEIYVAKKLVNILPESFKPFEDKALEIIKSAGYSEAIKNIEYNYLSGRLIA